MIFQQDEWAQAGKLLLLVSGVACVCLALYRDSGALSFFLRVWVGFFGGVSVLVALADARPR
jgi:hypothetical protein